MMEMRYGLRLRPYTDYAYDTHGIRTTTELAKGVHQVIARNWYELKRAGYIGLYRYLGKRALGCVQREMYQDMGRQTKQHYVVVHPQPDGREDIIGIARIRPEAKLFAMRSWQGVPPRLAQFLGRVIGGRKQLRSYLPTWNVSVHLDRGGSPEAELANRYSAVYEELSGIIHNPDDSAQAWTVISQGNDRLAIVQRVAAAKAGYVSTLRGRYDYLESDWHIPPRNEVFVSGYAAGDDDLFTTIPRRFYEAETTSQIASLSA